MAQKRTTGSGVTIAINICNVNIAFSVIFKVKHNDCIAFNISGIVVMSLESK